MKKIITVLCALSALTAAFAADSDVIFDAAYDTYNLAADKAAGDKTASKFPEPDLQLRMFPGVNGKGNSLLIANNERLTYKAKGNFDASQGTVSLWLQTVNYDLANGGIQTFFCVSGSAGKKSGYYFRLIKNGREWKDFLIAQLYFRGAEMTKPFRKQIQFKTTNWKKGTWHHIALTWNRNHFAMYVDGVLHPHSSTAGPRVNAEGKGIPYDHPDAKFDFALPPTPDNAVIYVGNMFSKAKADDKTAFDRVRIFKGLHTFAGVWSPDGGPGWVIFNRFNNDRARDELGLPDGYVVFALRSYGDVLCFHEEEGDGKVYLWDIEEGAFTEIWDSFTDWITEEIDDGVRLIADGVLEPLSIKAEDTDDE